MFIGLYLAGLVAAVLFTADGVVWILVPRWHRTVEKRILAGFRGAKAKHVSTRGMMWGRVRGSVLACLGAAVFAVVPVEIAPTARPGRPRGVTPGLQALQQTVDSLLHQQVDRGPTVGVSIGLLIGSDSMDVSYGATGRGGLAPDCKTLYEVGSITKVFTALLLASLHEQHQIDMEDPLQKYLPGVELPSPARGIRLIHLACHSSGLPRVPDDLVTFCGVCTLGAMFDPFAGYDIARLDRYMGRCRLNHPPGIAYEYSNVGMAILGRALASAQHESYGDLLRRHVCEPLGMAHSFVGDSGSLVCHLSEPYEGKAWGILAFRARSWKMGVFQSAGGLRSNVEDMLRFLRAQLSPPTTTLGQAISVSHQPRIDAGPSMRVAMGWLIDQTVGESPVYWHDGMTSGYASFIAFSPRWRVGVVVLTNSSSSVRDMGFSILRAAITQVSTGQITAGQ